MLSRPDFLEKQIIVIHSYQLRGLRFANENLIVEEDGIVIEQATLHKIFAVFLIGEATISTKLIMKLKDFWILLILLRKNLELIDVIGDDLSGNSLLRQKQYFLFESGDAADSLARIIVTNKILNQESVLRKLREKDEIQKHTADKLHTLAGNAKLCQRSEKLLGIEGNAAKYFFHEYYLEMEWMGRYPRTKIDRNNLLLDIGYTFLFHFIEALLALYGFDLYKWFYHQEFYQRKSLVCDIEEPFRCIIDESIRKAFNLGRILPKDFGFANGAYFLKPEAVQKYSGIFARAILDHRESMYQYVYDLYRYVLGMSRHEPFYSFS